MSTRVRRQLAQGLELLRLLRNIVSRENLPMLKLRSPGVKENIKSIRFM